MTQPTNAGANVDVVGPSGRIAGTPNRTLLIASLATLATFLDTTILFVAYPDIAATFTGSSSGQLSWVLNAYTIGFAALLIPAGKLADRIGHRRVFLTGSAVFTIASMACGLAASTELLIAFRVIQAVGAAALIPSSLALVMHAFTREQLPRAVAIWGAAGAVAGALGPTLGATIVETLGWRWAFFINLPVGIYTVMAGRRHLQESSDPATRLPALLGVGLIAAAAGLLSYAVVATEIVGWRSGRTLATFAAGGLVIAVLILHQRRTTAPVLDLELFRIRNFIWANIAMLVFGTAFSALFLGSILFLTQVWDWSILQAGFGVAVGPIMVGLVSPRVGALAGRIGQRPILLIGGALYASSGAYRLIMLGPNSDYFRDYLPSMLLSGVGVGMVFPQLSSVVAQALPPNRRGVGGAALQAGRQFGGTFGVALTVAFLSAGGGAAATLMAFDRIWWLIVLGGLATSALTLPLLTSGTTVEAAVEATVEAAVTAGDGGG
jgi:EmrB/QacA subfamily drug resistance transporter